jgi:transposase
VNESETIALLTEKQLRVIPYLLSSPSIEDGCKRARVGKTTVYEWLKEGNFRQELKRRRDEMIGRALDSLKANIAKATETLVKHLDSDKEAISIRAAESIIEFAKQAREHEELEARIASLERKLEVYEKHAR